MINRQAALLGGGLIFGMLIAGLWTIAVLPPNAHIATHWGVDGHPNGWMNKWLGLLTVPAVAALVWGLIAIIPSIDPRGANLARSPGAYGVIWVGSMAMTTLAQAVIIAAAMGFEVDVTRLMSAALGVLFIFIGNVLGKIRSNYFVGFRTPWALQDERVWDKTQRFGGRALVACGFIILIAAFAAPARIAFATAVLATVAGISVTVLKSYFFWRDRQREQT